jgi:hypothetical protein
MKENAADFRLDPFVGPIGMLALKERRFVPTHGPVKPVSRLPPLLGRHASQ